MARLFDAGQASQVSTPGAPSPADIAQKLFAIKLMLARLSQGGGAPQTLGEYIKGGPRKLPSGVMGEASNALMQALSQPGAFQRGASTQKYKPSSPSLFQEGSSALVTLAMLSSLLKGQGGISGTASSGFDWLKGLLGGDMGMGIAGSGVPLADAGTSGFDWSSFGSSEPGIGVNAMDSGAVGDSYLSSLLNFS